MIRLAIDESPGSPSSRSNWRSGRASQPSAWDWCWRLVLLVIRLGGTAPLAGQGLTASLVLFVGGVQLLTVGVLGEYIGRIYTEVRQRPLYTVREVKCPEGYKGPEGYRQLP